MQKANSIFVQAWFKKETTCIPLPKYSIRYVTKAKKIHPGINPKRLKENGDQMSHVENIEKYGSNYLDQDLLEHIETIKNQYKYT